jgi:hypothetical protein
MRWAARSSVSSGLHDLTCFVMRCSTCMKIFLCPVSASLRDTAE